MERDIDNHKQVWEQPVLENKPNVYSSTGQQTLCRLDLLKWLITETVGRVLQTNRFNKSLLSKAFADLSRSKHLQFITAIFGK